MPTIPGSFIPRFAFWNPSTWAIPELYWDTFSQEQRIHAICKQLGKVIAYADMLGVNVDDIAARLKAIEDGQLDDLIIAEIEQWFEDNQPEIMQAIAAINDALPITAFDAENTVEAAITSNTNAINALDDAVDVLQLTVNFITPEQFGAVGDGVTDDSQAFADMLDYYGQNEVSSINLSDKTYIVNESLTINDDVVINGNNAIIDMSGNVDANNLIVSGSYETIGSLAANVSKNGASISVTGGQTLAENDLITILDSTTYSWSSYRDYYRTGEFNSVKAASGNTYTLKNRLYDDYPAGSIVCKISPVKAIISDLTVIGKNTGAVAGKASVQIVYGKDCVISNCSGSGSNDAQIELAYCFDCSIDDCNIDYVASTGVGLNYGIAIANSQNIKISNCSVNSLRHAITIGGYFTTTSVVSRNILVSSCVLYSQTISAADAHGNTDNVTYQNCVIEGCNLGGSNTILNSNVIRADPSNYCINLVERKDANVTIQGNIIEDYNATTDFNFIRCVESDEGGTIDFSNNTVTSANKNRLTFSFSSVVCDVTCIGNQLDNVFPIINNVGIAKFNGNTVKGSSVQLTRIKELSAQGNMIFDNDSLLYSIQTLGYDANSNAVITGNEVSNCGGCAIYANGFMITSIIANAVYHPNMNTGSTSIDTSGIFVSNITNAVLTGNNIVKGTNTATAVNVYSATNSIEDNNLVTPV